MLSQTLAGYGLERLTRIGVPAAINDVLARHVDPDGSRNGHTPTPSSCLPLPGSATPRFLRRPSSDVASAHGRAGARHRGDDETRGGPAFARRQRVTIGLPREERVEQRTRHLPGGIHATYEEPRMKNLLDATGAVGF